MNMTVEMYKQAVYHAMSATLLECARVPKSKTLAVVPKQ